MLRTAGFEIWLDDYHASYFTALNQLGWQFDGIKIDRAYFHLNRQNPDEMAEQLARVAIFGTQTIVEGIETTDDLRLAQQLNVQYGQGFYLQETAIMQPDAFIFPSCHSWPDAFQTANGL